MYLNAGKYSKLSKFTVAPANKKFNSMNELPIELVLERDSIIAPYREAFPITLSPVITKFEHFEEKEVWTKVNIAFAGKS